MKLIVALLLSINSSFGSSPTEPHVSKSTVASTISIGHYEDVRIDSDLDGIIDAWYLKKQDTNIIIRFKDGTVSSIEIKKFKGNQVSSRLFQNTTKKNLISTDLEVRPLLKMNGELCVEHKENAVEKLKQFTQEVSINQIGKNVSSVVQCEGSPASDALTSATISVAGMDSSPDGLSSCLKKDELRAKFKSNKTAIADLDYLAAKIELDSKRIARGDESVKGLITCETSRDSKSLKGEYTENNGIKFKVPSNFKSDDADIIQTKNLVYHELLHRAGVNSEKFIDGVIDHCFNNGKLEVTTYYKEQSLLGPFKGKPAKAQDELGKRDANTKNVAENAIPVKPTRGPSSTGDETGGGGIGINVSKEVSVAEVQQAIPSPSTLAKGSATQSEAQAVASSQAQSAPVFAMADRAMGIMNTPALASDDSSSGSSSSRTASNDRYQSRYNGYESTASKSRSTSADRDLSKGVYLAGNKNSRIVEEVDLTKGNSASAATTGSTRTTNAASGNSRMIASTGRTAAADAGSDEAAAGSGASAAGGGSAGSSAGGSGTYFATGSGAANTRKTNAATRGGSAGSANGSRDDILSNFTGTSYTVAKDMLKDSSFQQKLVEYQITVIDNTGSRWGASKGKTVFSDDGNRFVRVK
jgi:hypothetical protein